MQLGTVTAIDRANRVVRAVLAGGQAIESTYFGDPPWPFSQAAFVPVGPHWHCDGALGDRRVVLHDDFTFVGTTPNFGDTPWVASGTGTTTATAGPTDFQGLVRLQTPNTALTFRSNYKTLDLVHPPTPPAALWWSSRLYPASNVTTSLVYRAGLADTDWSNTPADRVILERSSTVGTVWTLVTASGGSSTTVDTAVTQADSEWITADIMYVPGVWAALWIDGAGPYISTSNIPTTAEPIVPGVYVAALAASARAVLIDWMHLEVVDPIVSPFDLDLAAA